MSALVDEVAKTLLPHAHKKGVRIEVAPRTDTQPLVADPTRLRQVLFNLAENALKFTPSGGEVHLGVTETEFEDGTGSGFGAVLMDMPRRAVAFTVRDTGIGVPESEFEKIFDAFYQVDGSATREHGGAGIGLSVVKRMTLMHGGRIDIASEVGAGTTFTVTIPEPDDDAV